MINLLHRTKDHGDVPERARLELSGTLLKQALEGLIKGSEELGGVEKYADAVRLKSQMFKDALGDGKYRDLDLDTFMGLCTFMATVRRRIGPYLEPDGFAKIKAGISELLMGASDTTTTDHRWAEFISRFPQDKHHRWVRDLAAEVLHGSDPERYPLMSRWVWDAKSNTGVIREIWYGDNVDNMTIPVPDHYETYVVLREELSQYLTSNGVYHNILEYVDLLCGQIYAAYISAQGGSYLKADFTSEMDPMENNRRILGLDGVRPNSTKTRLKSYDGEAYVIEDTKLLN